MKKTHTIEDFYRDKFKCIPDSLKKGMGHFNVFRHQEFVGKPSLPFNRSDYYKISLLIGKRKIHFPDHSVETGKWTLLFINPEKPILLEAIDEQIDGYCCIFTLSFFYHFGNLKEYPIFRADDSPFFNLTQEQALSIERIYQRMFEEINSNYLYKYDLLKMLVFELVHLVQKMFPICRKTPTESNAAHRIAMQFLELLERQFPIENIAHRFTLRSASDFANQMAVHVNHLNKALREITHKTTSEIIAERILHESKILLKTTPWNISEIAYALGFKETTHFNNFFKKHLTISPTNFRMD